MRSWTLEGPLEKNAIAVLADQDTCHDEDPVGAWLQKG